MEFKKEFNAFLLTIIAMPLFCFLIWFGPKWKDIDIKIIILAIILVPFLSFIFNIYILIIAEFLLFIYYFFKAGIAIGESLKEIK